MAQPFYTIGHSTRPIGDFVDLLRSAGVMFVADDHTMRLIVPCERSVSCARSTFRSAILKLPS